MTRITSVQDRYDLLTRERQDVLEFCADHGILFLPWFPPREDENLAAIDLDLTAEEVRELSVLPGIGTGV